MATAEELIKQRISELPPYVKQAIGEAQATVKLRDIGLRRKLRIDQQAVMEREVMLVMLGFETESAFVRNLVAEAQIPLPEAQQLAEEIGNEIFSHIRASMRRMTEERQQAAKAPQAPQQAPAPAAAAAKPAAPRSVVPPSAAASLTKAPAAPAPAPVQPAAVAPAPVPAPAPAPPPVASTPAAPAVAAAAATLAPVAEALAAPQSAPGTVANVGLSSQKPGYKTDPYREEIE